MGIMSWMRGEIARRLALSFAVFSIIVISAVIIAIMVVQNLNTNFADAMIRTNLTLLGLQVRTESQAMINLSQHYVVTSIALEEREKLRTQITQHRANLNLLIEQAVELTTPEDLIERTLLAKIQENVVNMNLQINRLLEAYDREQAYGPETLDQMNILISDYQEPLAEQILAFQEYETSRVRDVEQSIYRVIRATLITLGILAISSVLLTFIMTGWSYQRILRPLSQLHAGVEQLRAGKMDKLLAVEGRDEISQLAETFNHMAARLKQTLHGLEINVHELRQTQQALQRSEEHYRSLFDGVPVGLYRSTVDGKILDANQALVKMLNYPDKAALLSTGAYELYTDGEDRKRWQALIEQDDQPLSYEVSFNCWDGKKIWVREISRGVRDERGRITHFEGSMEDITERKQAETEVKILNAELEQRVIDRTVELEAANKELEAFSYSVSHDLRAPLRALDGYSQALMEDYHEVLDATAQNYLVRLRSASQKMGELIDDLLLLSRISQRELDRTRVDLSQIVRHIAQELQEAEPDRQVSFVIKDGLLAKADINLIRLVLDNLLSNAWKFTARHPEACIEFGSFEQHGETVFFVRDDGAGFDAIYVHKLFGPFQRLHAATEFEGTGIGLATVHRIIRRHGGNIWANGEVEKGATFYFTLAA